MTLDEIKRLIEFVRSQDLAEFELEQDGVKLRIKSGAASPQSVHVMPVVPTLATPAVEVGTAPVAPGAPEHRTAPAHPSAPDELEAPEEGAELAIVKSPIVGTFYRAAEPGAQAFVEIGDIVKKGQVLCIIEAMKLMNEIDSEYDGEILSIYVENGQAVQYGERLFAIRLRT
ncbi:MAG TPA: acetyl-CoA carboxylase biotin carboxyl carrier protein [Vicinamibacterales bacterium]|nr:acetyl-CoA carboxylase biotin carboxyl carrier protein [Vicinamibacterales bacterium]